jgi:hypothetical protein
VGRAAGESEHPISSKCRAFLEEVLKICHRVTLTAALLEEWNRHRSRFAKTWLVSMYARKKVDRFDIEADQALRARVSAAATSQEERDGMLKDLHLVEAALQADAPVVSLDEMTARVPLRSASRTVRRLRSVVWVNPTADDENTLEWLRNGAQSEASRCLGFAVGD